MLMQGYDFLRLYNDHGCKLQFGGDDQWSNILGGIELIRRHSGGEAYGLTFTLLTTSEGKKMGKTQGGAVWLDPKKTTPYEFYQYWRNTRDDDVVKCLKMLTFVPLEQIYEYEKLEGSQLNTAKERLAYELTLMVHGEEEAEKCMATARSLFSVNQESQDMPATVLADEDFANGSIGILDILAISKLAPSKSEARRLIQQGGVFVCGEKVDSVDFVLEREFIKQNQVVIKKGKKTFHKIDCQ